MYNTTGNPKPMGECHICGYMVFFGLMHACSTAPKPKKIHLEPIASRESYYDKKKDIHYYEGDECFECFKKHGKCPL